MKGYKGFNKNLTCLGFQYEEGQTYKHEGNIELCDSGFHFCQNPFDVLDFYNLCDSEFTEVEASGEIKSNNQKTVTNEIKIGFRLGLKGFIDAAFSFLWNQCKTEQISSGGFSDLAASGGFSKLAASGYSSKLAASGGFSDLAASGYSSKLAASGDYSKLAASGDYSKLAASGYSSQLAASGDSSQLAASGDSSLLAVSGDYSKLAASGYSSQLAVNGQYSVGAAIGINNKIKATLGCWITLAEWKWDGERHAPKCVKSAQIDGEALKADTWYKLEKGEFVEIADE